MAFFSQGLNPKLSAPRKKLGRQLGAAILGGALSLALGHPALGQAVTSATITEVLDSNQVYIQNRAAQVNSVAQQRQQVRTQAARTSLRFNTGAVGRLGHNSSLVIGQCAQLNRGSLLVNGSVNGCSTSTLAGVRGTIYTIQVNEAGQTIVQVFEGEVVVERHNQIEPVDPVGGSDNLNPLTDPAVPSTDPVVPFVNPVEPPVRPVEPPINPVEPPIRPVEPPIRPVEPPIRPVEPSISPVEPSISPVEPPSFFPEPDTDLPTGTFLLNFSPFNSFEAAEAVTDKPSDRLPDHSLWVAYNKQNVLPSPSRDASEGDAPGGDVPGDSVGFTENDVITVAEGQQIIIDPEGDEAVIAPLTAEDFVALLEGPLVRGFALDLPGIGNLRSTFQRLFPGLPLPSYWRPPIPTPPIRFPFPF